MLSCPALPSAPSAPLPCQQGLHDAAALAAAVVVPGCPHAIDAEGLQLHMGSRSGVPASHPHGMLTLELISSSCRRDGEWSLYSLQRRQQTQEGKLAPPQGCEASLAHGPLVVVLQPLQFTRVVLIEVGKMWFRNGTANVYEGTKHQAAISTNISVPCFPAFLALDRCHHSQQFSCSLTLLSQVSLTNSLYPSRNRVH